MLHLNQSLVNVPGRRNGGPEEDHVKEYLENPFKSNQQKDVATGQDR